MPSGNRKKVAIRSLSAVIAAAAGMSVLSRKFRHRSAAASTIESMFRITGMKKRFSDAESCERFIESHRGREPFRLNTRSVRSTVTESETNGCRVYTFRGGDGGTVIYLHGGAFVEDVSFYHTSFCDRLARGTSFNVVLPVYPLAPDHTATEALRMIETLYGDYPPEKTVLMGESAGGGLCMSLSEMLLASGRAQPAAIVLFSPWLDATMSNPDIAKYESSDMLLSAEGLAKIGRIWAGELSPGDFRVSPMFGNVVGAAATYLFTGTREIFCPDVGKFYGILKDAGVKTELFTGENLGHGYPLYPIPEANKAFLKVKEILDAACPEKE